LDFIEKIRKDINSRNAVIKELYTSKSLRKTVSAFVYKNKGNDTDVFDLMTHGVMTFIKQCYRPDFALKKTAEGYIFSTIKYEWFRRNKNSLKLVDEDHRPELSSSVTALDSMIDAERKGALKKALAQLDDKCREVLTMWASNLKMREIALTMDYASEGMARKKKHNCLKKLRQLTKDI